MPSMNEFGNNLYTGKTSFPFVGRRRLWFIIAIALVVGSAGAVLGAAGRDEGGAPAPGRDAPFASVIVSSSGAQRTLYFGWLWTLSSSMICLSIFLVDGSTHLRTSKPRAMSEEYMWPL